MGYFFFPEENPTAITATIKLAKPIIRLIPSYIENIASPPFFEEVHCPTQLLAILLNYTIITLENTNICSIFYQNSPIRLFLKIFRLTKENPPFPFTLLYNNLIHFLERSVKMSRAEKTQIYFLLVFVMFAWGLNVIATKIIVTTFPPVTITSLRIFTAGIGVFLFMFMIKKVRFPTKKEFFYILIALLFNVVAHHYFLAIGLGQTTASNGGLILGLAPLLSTIFAFLFLGAKITKLKIIGILLGFSGVCFIVFEGNSGIDSISIGDLFVFLSILLQAFSFVMIKKISTTLDPRLMTGYMLVLGSILLFIISLILEPSGLKDVKNGSFEIWMIFLGSAVIATAVGHMTYNYAIGKVGIVESSIFVNLQPLFALISAFIFLGETITFSQIFGFLFILLGVLFGSGAIVVKSKLKIKNSLKSSA